MKLEHNGDVWVDKSTGEIYTQSQVDSFNNEKILTDHKAYMERSLEYGTENKYTVIELPSKESNKKRVKEGYKFNMMHRTDLRKIIFSGKLKAKEIAFIGGLTPFICFPDNDVKFNNQYLTLDSIGKLIDCGENRMTTVIKTLESQEIIKMIRGGNKPPVIYFNPFLYSSGREVSEETYNMFIDSKYNPNVSKDMNKYNDLYVIEGRRENWQTALRVMWQYGYRKV